MPMSSFRDYYRELMKRLTKRSTGKSHEALSKKKASIDMTATGGT